MVVTFEQIVRDINAHLPHPHTYEPPRSKPSENAVTIRVDGPEGGRPMAPTRPDRL